MKRVLFLAIVAAGLVAAGIGVGAMAWAGGDHTTSSTPSHEGTGDHGSLTGMMEATLGERAFLEQMVPHHASAVRMATLALEKTTRPEIRRLATQIVSSQEAEIARMRPWHRAWFGEEMATSGVGPHADMDMSELEAAKGHDFDRAFLAMMLPHHASAVMMAHAVRLGGPRAELATLADEIIAAQAKEIGQMQRWREQWYPPLG